MLACNIITDAYLLWLPMPMLFQSTLPKVTKIVLMLLFGCGVFVTGAAVMTIVFVVTVSKFYYLINPPPFLFTHISFLAFQVGRKSFLFFFFLKKKEN